MTTSDLAQRVERCASTPSSESLPPDAEAVVGELLDALERGDVRAAECGTDGSWRAGSGAIFDLNGNALRPATWTSADAAGLPILPGLVRYEEVIAGEA